MSEARQSHILTPARWRSILGRWLLVIDVVVISAASVAAFAVRDWLGEIGVIGRFASELPLAFAVMPVWILTLYLSGSYRPELQGQTGEALRRFVASATVSTLVLGFLSFLLKLELARVYVGLLFMFVIAFGTTSRAAVRWALRRRRQRGELIQHVLVVGTDPDALTVVRGMQLDLGAGYRVVGFIDDDPRATTVLGLPVLGGTERILDVASELGVGLVLVSPGGVEPGTLQELTVMLEGTDVDLAVAPSLFQVVTRRVTVESIGNVPILHVEQIRLARGKAAAKRLLDLVGGITLLVLFAPVMAVAAVAVRVGDGGTVLFRQQRVGRDGDVFTLLKFRTMVEDAEERLDEIEHLNEAGQHFFKIRQDPRITRVGRVLRKWSVDEMPQLVNVLRGDMSLVGPRPPLPSEVEHYADWQRRRLRVRPGITGVWQVSGRSNVPFDEAVQMDIFYIENWSLGYDLFLLAKTAWAVLGRQGAY